MCELSDSLHADAGDGKNALNQIRRRVNDIIKESGTAGAGRSALDARFALGADDATYANAAIAPIYASFDTDELDMVDTPAEVREASAVGVVSAFDAMLETKRATAVRDLRVCARFVGWLMQVEEVREVVLELAGPALEEGRAARLMAAFAESPTVGQAELGRLVDGESYGEIRELFKALHILVDEDCDAMKLSRQLDDGNVRNVVKSAQADLERLVQAFLIMGKDPTTWCNSTRFASGVTAAASSSESVTPDAGAGPPEPVEFPPSAAPEVVNAMFDDSGLLSREPSARDDDGNSRAYE